MNRWKKIMALSFGVGIALTGIAAAEEFPVTPASEYQVSDNHEPAGLIGGSGIVDGISEDVNTPGMVAGFDASGTSQGSFDTFILADGIEVTVSDAYTNFAGQDGNFYVCPYREYEIPYVMFGMYSYSGDDFYDVLTPEVYNACEDAEVTTPSHTVQVGDYTMQEIVYNYTLSGNSIVDRRLSIKVDDMFIVFGSKECSNLNLTLGYLLDEVAGGLKIEGEAPEYDFDIAFDSSWANYQGKWINFDDSYQIYLPAYWIRYDLTEEDLAKNTYFHCGNSTGDNIVGNIDVHAVVCKSQVTDDFSFEGMADTLANVGYENVFIGKVNDIEVIAYELTHMNLIGFFFQSPNEPYAVISVEGYYSGDKNIAADQMVQAIVCSVSPIK